MKNNKNELIIKRSFEVNEYLGPSTSPTVFVRAIYFLGGKHLILLVLF